MTQIGVGVFKSVSIKKQAGLNQKAAAAPAGSARQRRRTASTLDLTKTSYASNEILTSQQSRDMRHGIRAVSGSLNTEASVGGQQPEFESILRQLAIGGDTTGAQTNFTAAIPDAVNFPNVMTVTRAAGSFITDGFNVGDVVNQVGWTTTGAPYNNNHYGIIVALSATVMTLRALDGQPFGAKASGDGVTISLVGKKTFTPQTGHTRDYYTIEHWFADLGKSEVFTDCVFTGATVTMPASGMVTYAFPVMGLNIATDVAQYFNAPAAPPSGPILASVNGVLLINGVAAGTVTAATITIAGNYTSPDGIVGANVKPDIFPGVLRVTGQITVLFADTVLRDLFLNETESSLMVVMTGNNSAAPGFTSYIMNRIKFSGSTKDDSFGGLTITAPFTALENIYGGVGTVYDQTTLAVQDSAWV